MVENDQIAIDSEDRELPIDRRLMTPLLRGKIIRIFAYEEADIAAAQMSLLSLSVLWSSDQGGLERCL